MLRLVPFLTHTLGGDTPERKYLALACFLLTRLRGCQITNKRDHVYAMLGLLESSIPRELPKGMQIIPDYSDNHTPINTYQRITQQMIEHLPTMSVLGLREDLGVRINPSSPSWVPDFSYPYVPTSIS